MDALKLYIKDIRHIPLLTAEQEKKVANRVKRGDAQARRIMVRSNLRLVINIAKNLPITACRFWTSSKRGISG